MTNKEAITILKRHVGEMMISLCDTDEHLEAEEKAIAALEKLDELKFIVEQEREFCKNNPDFLMILQPIKLALESDKINWRNKYEA